MPPAEAERLRVLIRMRMQKVGARIDDVIPERWCNRKNSPSAALRKVGRVLSRRAPLALEDAFDLIWHCAFGFTDEDETKRWVLQAPRADIENVLKAKARFEAANKRLIARVRAGTLDPVVGDNKQQKLAGEHLASMDAAREAHEAFQEANSLLLVGVPYPAVAIFPGHTDGLAQRLVDIAATRLGHRDIRTQNGLRRDFTDFLSRFESQLASEDGKDLILWLENWHGKQYAKHFIGFPDRLPIGSAQQVPENPWRLMRRGQPPERPHTNGTLREAHAGRRGPTKKAASQ